MSTQKILIGLGLAAVVVFGREASAQIKNGHFENGGSGIAPPLWTEVGGVVQDPPEGAGLGGPGSNSAVFTSGAGVPVGPNHKGAGIGQRFKCGPYNPQATCYIRFTYAFDEGQNGGRAFVYVNGVNGPLLVELPDNIPPGPGTVQIGYAGCGKMKIKFGIIEPGPAQPFQSTFLVDDVVAMCSTQPWPGIPQLDLTPYSGVPGQPAADLLKEICDKMGGFQSMGGGTPGHNGLIPELLGQGPVTPGSQNVITLQDGLPGATGVLIVGFADINLPFVHGTLVPQPTLVLPAVVVGPDWIIITNFNWPAGAVGVDVYAQYALQDPAAFAGVALSNALWIEGQ